MINHVRTLILNRSGNQYLPDAPGEVYVPALFREIQLPPTLQAVYDELLGRRSDRLYKNYRMQQYMTLLHASERSEYLTQSDKRLTYSDNVDTTFFDRIFGHSVVQLSGSPATSAFVSGDMAGVGIDRCQYAWNVSVIDETQVQVRQLQGGEIDSFAYTLLPYSTAYSMGSPIPLPGTALSVRIRQPEIGSSFLIRYNVKPRPELTDVLENAKRLYESHANDIDIDTATMQWAVTAMASHQLAVERYAAMLLLYAHAVERVSRR